MGQRGDDIAVRDARTGGRMTSRWQLTRSGYAALGALCLLLGVISIGAASVSVQMGGAGWIALAVLLGALTVVWFWAAVVLLRFGRINQPRSRGGAGDRHPAP